MPQAAQLQLAVSQHPDAQQLQLALLPSGSSSHAPLGSAGPSALTRAVALPESAAPSRALVLADPSMTSEQQLAVLPAAEQLAVIQERLQHQIAAGPGFKVRRHGDQCWDITQRCVCEHWTYSSLMPAAFLHMSHSILVTVGGITDQPMSPSRVATCHALAHWMVLRKADLGTHPC